MNPGTLNILILGINYAPEPTGIGKYTGELGSWLASNGHRVQVVTGFPYYPQWKLADGYRHYWFQNDSINGVTIRRCPLYVPARPGGMKRMLQDLSFLFSSFLAVNRLLWKGEQHSIVFVASPSFLSGWLGCWYKWRRPRTQLVYHIQDLQIDAAEELGMIKQPWLLKWLKRSEAFILKRADVVSTISVGMQRRIEAKGLAIKKQLLFPNWVDFSQVYAMKPTAAVIADLGIPLEKPIALYAGALGEKQGIEIILDAAEKAKSTLPHLHFVVAGSGPYANQLQQRAIGRSLTNLQFIPLQPLDVFNQLLNHAWLHLVVQKDKASDLLLPSKLTNICAVGGLALVTASAGTSLYEIAQQHDLAYTIPPDNAEALHEALVWLDAHPEAAGRFKANAAQYARQHLEQSAIIERFLQQVG